MWLSGRWHTRFRMGVSVRSTGYSAYSLQRNSPIQHLLETVSSKQTKRQTRPETKKNIAMPAPTRHPRQFISHGHPEQRDHRRSSTSRSESEPHTETGNLATGGVLCPRSVDDFRLVSVVIGSPIRQPSILPQNLPASRMATSQRAPT